MMQEVDISLYTRQESIHSEVTTNKVNPRIQVYSSITSSLDGCSLETYVERLFIRGQFRIKLLILDKTL